MTRALLLAAIALLVTACGLKGNLETPGPMWGDPNREVVQRGLPGTADSDTRLVFTRDDVDLFKEDEEERDPFADEDAEDSDDDDGLLNGLFSGGSD